MSNKIGSMPYYLNMIEQILINDEIFMRLLKYQPEEITGVSPLDESLPNVVDDSEEYWDLVNERFRRGNKRTDIENDSIVIVYMYEGRARTVWKNQYLTNQEIRFSIFIHHSFESDSRISLISDRIGRLILDRDNHIGYSPPRLLGKNPYEAPMGYRKQEDTYLITINTRIGCW